MSTKATPLRTEKLKGLILEIELLRIEPVISRTIVVPDTITLPDLHFVLQEAMGWECDHAHEFIIDHIRYSEEHSYDPYREKTKCEDDVALIEALGSKRMFMYIYDFGDEWEHRIRLKKTMVLSEPLTAAQCLEGANACPPEDVGGPYGYANFVAAMADPNDEDHEEWMEWWGEPFDPTDFSLKKTNNRLRKIKL